MTPSFKPGDLFLNLKPEIDSDDGIERTTKPGRLWVVSLVEIHPSEIVYHIVCPETDAHICPTEADLKDETQYSLVFDSVALAKGVALAMRYDARLNEIEQSPNGDDYNNLIACLGGTYEDPINLSR